MAIKRMTFSCDQCYEEEEGFTSEEEALEAGWYILRGPERSLGGKGEVVYCSGECLEQSL